MNAKQLIGHLLKILLALQSVLWWSVLSIFSLIGCKSVCLLICPSEISNSFTRRIKGFSLTSNRFFQPVRYRNPCWISEKPYSSVSWKPLRYFQNVKSFSNKLKVLARLGTKRGALCIVSLWHWQLSYSGPILHSD